MKKVALWAGGVVAAVVAVALVAIIAVPAFMDWNSYRAEIAERLEAALGRKVAIEGDLSLSVLPRPALSVEGVRLANLAGASDADMATLKALSVRLSPLPLLRGNVKVDSLVLVAPVVNLEMLADGRANWQFDAGSPRAAGALPPAQGGEGAPARPASRDGDISLDRVVIEDGIIVYRRPGAPPERVEDLDLVLSMSSLQGPFQAEGTARARGVPVGFAVTAGTLAGAQSVPVTATLRLPQSGAELRLSGQASDLQGKQSFKGRLAAEGPNLAAAAGAFVPGAVPAALARPFSVAGMLGASGAEAALDDVTIRLGQTEGGGALRLVLGATPSADLALTFNRIDLDEWRGAAPAAAPAPPPAAKAPQGAVSGGQSPDEPAVAGGFSLPKDIAAALDLSAEVVVWREAIIRQVRLNAALDGGEIVVNQAAALLPGGSDLGVFGTVRAADGQPLVDASFEAASDNLRNVLEWLGVDVGGVPADRLRKFSAAGKVAGTPAAVEISKLAVQLDTTKLNGAANIRLGERLGIGANVIVDNINVDAYTAKAQPATKTPARSPAPAPADGPAPGTTSASTGDPLAGLAVLAGIDANVKGRVGQLTVGGIGMQDLRLDATLVRGELTLREAAVGDIGGATAAIRGGLGGLGTGAPEMRALAVEVKAPQPARLLRLFDIALPVEAEALGRLGLAATLNGPLAEMALDGRLEAAGAAIVAKGKVSPLRAVGYDLAIEASHPDAMALVRLFAPTYRPNGPLGKLALSGRLSGDAAAISIADLDAAVGPTELAGEARVTLDGAKPAVSANLRAGELVVDRFLPAKRTAQLPPRPALAVQPVSLQLAQAQAAPQKSAPGAAPWPSEPLDLSALRSFDADLVLDAKLLAYDAYRLDAAKLALKVVDGTAVVDSLTGGLFGGELAMKGSVGGAGEVAMLDADLSIANAQLRQALVGAAGIDVAAGTMNAKAKLGGGGRSVADIIAALDGTAALDVKNGAVQGFDLAAVSRQLNDIENIASVLQLLQAGMGGGTTTFSSLTGNFRIDDGVVRSDDLLLQAEAGRGNGTLAANLPQYAVDARFAFTLTAHPNLPAFGVRLTGPLDNPRRVFEANELQAYLVSRGMGRLLKGKGGDAGRLIEGILGGGKPSQPAPAAQPAPQAAPAPERQPAPAPQQPQKPEQVLKDMLKDFMRRQR